MMNNIVTNHIKSYVDASENDLHVFTSALTQIKVAKGKFLLQPGTHVKHEYFVIDGCLKSYYLDLKGHKHVIQFAIENWWVGDFEAFYQHLPSKLYIEAIEDAQLLSVSYHNLQHIYKEAPIFERYFRILTTNGFIAQRKRILSTLEKNTKDRYLEFCQSYPKIEDRVANYDIANYLGVTPENLSRVRRQLKG